MARKKRELSAAELALFTRLFLEGVDRHEITIAIGIYHDRTRNMMAAMSYWQKDARHKNRLKRLAARGSHNAIRKGPSDKAWAEREMRMSAPRSLTAEFFGDPRQGQSALDKREVA